MGVPRRSSSALTSPLSGRAWSFHQIRAAAASSEGGQRQGECKNGCQSALRSRRGSAPLFQPLQVVHADQGGQGLAPALDDVVLAAVGDLRHQV